MVQDVLQVADLPLCMSTAPAVCSCMLWRCWVKVCCSCTTILHLMPETNHAVMLLVPQNNPWGPPAPPAAGGGLGASPFAPYGELQHGLERSS
jgi:hypothetical protein